jgi:hypothetical protein
VIDGDGSSEVAVTDLELHILADQLIRHRSKIQVGRPVAPQVLGDGSEDSYLREARAVALDLGVDPFQIL